MQQIPEENESRIKRLLQRGLYHAVVVVSAYAIVGFWAVTALNLSFLNPISQVVSDFSMTDIFYEILGDTREPEMSHAITIVDMGYIFDREGLAKALNDVEAQEPKVIGVDVVFQGFREDAYADSLVAGVARNYDNIVWSFRMLNNIGGETQYTESVHSFFAPEVPNMTEGFTEMPRNYYGGIKRKMMMGSKLMGEPQPSFLAQMLNKYAGSEVVPMESKTLDINFTPTTFIIVPADSVSKYPELIKGRMVLFGSMTDESDMHYTPLGKIAGVVLLAYSLQTLLEQKEVKTPDTWVMVVASFLLVFIVEIIYFRYRRGAAQLKNRWMRHLLPTTFFFTFVNFLTMGILMGLAFMLFVRWQVSFNLGWTFTGMAFLEKGRGIWDAMVKIIKKE